MANQDRGARSGGVDGPGSQEPRIAECGERKLVGVSGRAAFGDSTIPALWRAMRPRVSEVARRVGGDFISLRIYDPPVDGTPRADAPFVYWASVEVEGFADVPAGFGTLTVPNGLYAVFEHRGAADDFERTAAFIFGEWLPQSPYRLAPRAFFEVLGPDYRPDDPDATEEVWIPVCPD